MCDYSLDLVASRPAKVGDKLVTTRFPSSSTRGFASVDDPNVAVCLRPGTEIAFDRYVESDSGLVFRSRREFEHKVARFRQLNTQQASMHHDALEFPDGQTVLLTALCEGQRATVLQLPADPRAETDDTAHSEPELAV